MAKKLLQDNEVQELQELLSLAWVALDNLFTGMRDIPTGINGNEQCFRKSDLDLLRKADKHLYELRDECDGTKKQRDHKFKQ